MKGTSRAIGQTGSGKTITVENKARRGVVVVNIGVEVVEGDEVTLGEEVG